MDAVRTIVIITIQLIAMWNSAHSLDCPYTNVTDHVSIGGREVPMVDTIDECRDWCGYNSSCVAAEWDAGTQQCFHHDSHPTERFPATGWTLFLFHCPCEDMISKMDNYAAVDGVLTPEGGNTSESCQDYCLSLPITLCGSWDFNLDTDECFIHTNTQPIKFKNDRVIHHMRELCINQTDCVDTFVSEERTGGWRGSKQPTIGDMRNCKALCLSKDFTECRAFDYNNEAKTCWFFTAEPIKYGNDKTTHYTRKKCVFGGATCPDEFIKLADGTAGTAGVPQGPGTFEQAEDCMRACRKVLISECLAIDYNRNDKTCFFFNSSPINTYSNLAVDHYIRKACVPSNDTCDHQYDDILNRGAHGGIEQPNVLKKALCKKLCDEKSNCSSFDFVFDTITGTEYETRCFLHDRPEFLLSKYDPQENNTISHYVKLPCGGQTTEPSMTTAYVCEHTWSETVGGYRGGQEQSGNMELTECQELCVQLAEHNRTCVAVDFRSTDKRCFTFTSLPPEVEKHDARDVKHYRVDLCVPETTAPPEPTTEEQTAAQTEAGCDFRFKPGTDHHAFGGTEFSSAKTLEECQKACLDGGLSQCQSVDFDIASRCYLHSNPNPTLYPGKGGVSHYAIDICPTTAAATIRTTTTPLSTTMGPPTTYRTLSTIATTRVVTQRPTTTVNIPTTPRSTAQPTRRPLTTVPRTTIPTTVLPRRTTRTPVT